VKLDCLQAMLTNYSVNAVTQGPEALATTRVSLTQRGRSTDEGLVTSAQVTPPPPPHTHTLFSLCLRGGGVPPHYPGLTCQTVCK